MTLRRFLTLVAAVAGTAAFLQAEQPKSDPAQPTFKEHRIGETAQQFFSIAKMAEKDGMLSTDYCKAHLSDPKVQKAIEKAKKKGLDSPSSLVVMIDVEGCHNVQAALAGKDIEVELRYAAEFGSGSAQFIAGRLASVNFVVKAPFRDVVDDMTAKLNTKPALDVHTYQDSVGAIIKQHRATWTLPSTFAKVSEVHSVERDIADSDNAETEVSVCDPATMDHRANSLN